MKMKKIVKGLAVGAAALTAGYVISKPIIEKKAAENRKRLNADNPHLKDSSPKPAANEYEESVKDKLDSIMAYCGIVALSPVLLGLSAAIYIDDPGPVFFKQKRVGKNKEYFELYKFRSMKMATPHDMPTHMLENPDQYITKVGKFIRKYSLDELAQLYNIYCGEMSVIGPRPALWNQDDLIAERDIYGANDVKPGLTGWAQINGRDELEIPVKAKLDGDYVEALHRGNFDAAAMDVKCFLGTVLSVLKHDGVVEGGTGEMNKEAAEEAGFEDYGHLKSFEIDRERNIKVLITGADSYIGTSFEKWAGENYPNIEVETVDTIDGTWREKDLSQYDAVFHVAGLAHADVGNVSDEVKAKYYAVNTDLAIEVAEKAKADGVKQFVFMSSMIIYGESVGYGRQKIVTAETVPNPANFYGDSKWQADKGVRALADDDFNVAVLRPPMIYGKGSKGNYPTMAKLAKMLPVFPDVDNQRSMLHIDNLCEFLCQLMLSGEGGIYFPQNSEYTRTSDMVASISQACGKNIINTKLLNPAVALGSQVPGKVGGLVNKAFGNMCYEQKLSRYQGINYEVNDLQTSISKTECGDECDDELPHVESTDYSVLMSVYYKENPEYLRESIDSMMVQTLAPEQIVIVEDGPLGYELEEVICQYEAEYPELFTVLRLEENGGLGNALNQGMKVCRNELVARMDTDDISLPERCEKEVGCFLADPELTIVGTQINEFINTPDNVVSSRVVPADNDSIKKFARRRSPFNHPTVMYRKSVFESLNGYQNSGRKEDLDLFLRWVNGGHKAKNLDEALLMYRSNSDNLKRRKTWQNCSEYISIMYGFYKKGYCGLGDMLYVTAGQMAMYLTPDGVTKALNEKFLRKGKI